MHVRARICTLGVQGHAWKGLCPGCNAPRGARCAAAPAGARGAPTGTKPSPVCLLTFEATQVLACAMKMGHGWASGLTIVLRNGGFRTMHSTVHTYDKYWASLTLIFQE